jgi:hypothetical protein
MAAHKTNPFLKWALIPLALFLFVILIIGISKSRHSQATTVIDPVLKNIKSSSNENTKNIKNNASKDSAEESLDTLTAELNETQQTIKAVIKTNDALKAQNETLLSQLQGKKDQKTMELSQAVEHLQSQIQTIASHPGASDTDKTNPNGSPITHVPELATTLGSNSAIKNNPTTTESSTEASAASLPEKPIPYYTIPANATAVEDRLMTALVGRIPVKGVVTDPYPFKLVFSDNTLAANGFRVPHLKQMIVSGYTEGDLNLVSVRGWVTSLTFVFNDGTISTTTSNDNNIGKFTKDSALGYLSDRFGNPFIRGKLITNAPAYVGANV